MTHLFRHSKCDRKKIWLYRLFIQNVWEYLKRKGLNNGANSSNADLTVLKTTSKKLKCFYCKKHFKKDCHKYKEWLKKQPKNASTNENKVEQNNHFLFHISSNSEANDEGGLIRVQQPMLRTTKSYSLHLIQLNMAKSRLLMTAKNMPKEKAHAWSTKTEKYQAQY